MSKYTRRRQVQQGLTDAHSMLAKVEKELSEDYVEVEPGGMSFTRLLCVYYVAARDTRARTMDSLRSLLRLTPAH